MNQINTSIVDTVFNVDTRFWVQSKCALRIKQWVGTVVAACGREWRFRSYSESIQRSFEGASLCFGHTETACSPYLGKCGRRIIPLVCYLFGTNDSL